MTFSSSKVRRKRKNINREIFFDWKINSQCSICEESIWAVQRMFSSWEWSGLWWCIYFWIVIRISWDMKIIHFPMTNSQLQANHIKPTWMPCINLTISVCFVSLCQCIRGFVDPFSILWIIYLGFSNKIEGYTFSSSTLQWG